MGCSSAIAVQNVIMVITVVVVAVVDSVARLRALNVPDLRRLVERRTGKMKQFSSSLLHFSFPPRPHPFCTASGVFFWAVLGALFLASV